MLYGKYRFICRLESEASLPFYKGSTFRGVFGLSLKRVVCALRLKECPDCILRESCLYYSVFESRSGDRDAQKGKAPSPPHPFVIEPPLDGERKYPTGERFECSLILFGETNDKLPYFVYAFEQMGKTGIGGRIKGERGRFTLEEVTADDQTIYSGETGKLVKGRCTETLSLAGRQEEKRVRPIIRRGRKLAPKSGAVFDTAGNPLRVRVTLETPLRLKFENRFTAELPFHVFVWAMLRRVSSLFNTYGGGEPELDYTGLVKEAQEVRSIESTLRWFDWERYSNRQREKMFMGGLVGHIIYEGDLAKYLPLMEICSKVHVGKQTTFGMGKIAWKIADAL